MAYRGAGSGGGTEAAAAARVEAFLDDFVETTHELPGEVRRMLHKVKELDEKAIKTVEQAESAASGKASRYRSKGKPHEGVAAVERDIDEVAGTVQELAEKKTVLIRRLLDLVDRVSEHLDSQLGEFQGHLKREGKWPEGEPDPLLSVAARKPIPSLEEIIPPRAPAGEHSAMDSEGTGPAMSEASTATNAATAAGRGAAATTGDQSAAERGAPVYDIPADPDEPRYCYCNQVSYGDMVACDNEESCEREWFHFSCVGLTETPSGGWRCPDCRRDSRKK